jgi:hypothetical protein
MDEMTGGQDRERDDARGAKSRPRTRAPTLARPGGDRIIFARCLRARAGRREALGIGVRTRPQRSGVV